MTRQQWITLAGLGSAFLLAGAFVFQALGWAPCAMCLWQRWPHAAAIIFAALGAVVPLRMLTIAGAGSAATSAGIAAYHSGVELKWWEGPASCTSSGQSLIGLDGDALVPGVSEVPALVLCDTLTPFFMGLTMANWNILASLVLTGIWFVAFTRSSA